MVNADVTMGWCYRLLQAIDGAPVVKNERESRD
jgi:hypothetical protein